MAQIDVKKGNQTGAGRQSAQGGGTGQGSQGTDAARQGMSWTRGRSGSGLSRETGGWGWPSRPLFSMNPMDLWSASPFELMRRMSDEMDRMFQSSGTTAAAAWVPAVEVSEHDGKLAITAELAGLKPEDVRVEAADEGLVIEGERKREHEETSGGRYRSERSYGFFRRVIPLPEDAMVDQAQARFTNGVLEVTVPLPEQSARRRQIPISSGAAGGEGSRSESATKPTQEEVGTHRR